MAEDLPSDVEYAAGLGVTSAEMPPKQVKSLEEAQALDPGTNFIDPTGKKRTVPYRAKTPEEADEFPEGVQFIDPSGAMRTTPKYESLDFTSQTLYDMSTNEKEREKALELSYPGKVKKHPRTGQSYVDDNGTLRRSKGAYDILPFLTAQVAPVAGAVAGEIGGAAAGTAIAPGPGTFGGAVAGGALGGAAGQAFNDAILALAGVYDRTTGEEAGELAISGALGGVGTAAGRGIAAVAPTVKGAIKNTLPTTAAGFLGAEQEPLARAIALREQGVMVPISAWGKEAPHLTNITEVLDPAFRTWKPLQKSATEYYEREAGDLLEEVGVGRPKSLTDPEAAVSAEPAGKALLARAQRLSQADASLRNVLETQRAVAAGRAEEGAAQIDALKIADRESRAAADAVINDGFKEIDAGIKKAMETIKAGRYGGDLWWQVGEKLKKVKLAIGQRAKVRYGQADRLAGAHLPNAEGLADTANAMLSQLPEGFEKNYPSIIKQIRDLAGEVDEHGVVVHEPVKPTFGQLHNLRTVIRNNVNWFDLTPDFRDGALKLFAGKVDGVLHDVHAVPELKAAAHMLDETDKWYGKVVRPLTDKNIQAVLSGLESGMPADPKRLYSTLIKEGRTELTDKVRKLVGPNLWGAVRAADTQEMLDMSRTLEPGVIDGRRFSQQVLERQRNGMLQAVHGKDAEKLLEQARRIEILEGRLDVPTHPGDTLTDVIVRARKVADATKEAAKRDPLAMLNKEMKAIDRAHARDAAKLKQQKLADPLSFLYKPTTGAVEAVDKILGNEDLILATAAKFGQDSSEFKMLRQVWAQRILQGTLEPGTRLEKMSEEVQRIMFPGATLDQMRLLASNMQFLMGTRAASAGTGRSIMATQTVEHPWGQHMPLPKTGHEKMRNVIAGNFMGRAILTKYFAMMTNLTNNTAFMRWVERGLRGSAESREMVKRELTKRMNFGGALGAAIGESQFSASQ